MRCLSCGSCSVAAQDTVVAQPGRSKLAPQKHHSPHPFLPENPSSGTQRVLGDVAKLPELVICWEEDANHSEKPKLKKSPFLHKHQPKSPGRTSVFPQPWRPWSCRVSGSDAQGRKTFLPCPAAEFQVINGSTAHTWKQLYVSMQRR